MSLAVLGGWRTPHHSAQSCPGEELDLDPCPLRLGFGRLGTRVAEGSLASHAQLGTHPSGPGWSGFILLPGLCDLGQDVSAGESPRFHPVRVYPPKATSVPSVLSRNRTEFRTRSPKELPGGLESQARAAARTRATGHGQCSLRAHALAAAGREAAQGSNWSF